MPVRWVLFDVGGVLERVDDDAWPQTFATRWAGRLGLTDQEWKQRLAAAELPDAGTRSGVAEEFWRRYGDAVGADEETLAVMRADFWDAYCGELDEELFGFARSLRGQVGLAILSNSGDGAREEEQRRFGFAAVFDPILYSHELGLAKPDPAVYALTLERLGAAPEEVAFVDDHEEAVAGALAAGIRAFRHTSTPNTIATIRGLLGKGSSSP